MSLARKILLGFLFVVIPMQVLAWNWRTKISLRLNNQPLSTACEIIEKEYGIHFSYSRDIVKMNRLVSLNAKEMTLRRVLDLLFTENGIEYKRIGDQLVLTVKQSNTRTISGFVEDAHTGEKLIGATVYFPKLQLGTTTNQYGFYSLTTAKDTMSLMVTYVSYSPMSIPLKDDVNKQMNIKLTPINTLQEVEITDQHLPPLQEQTQMSKVGVAVAQAKAMPRMLGETDVLRTIQAMPGVGGGMEGTSSIHVRGGSPDQNLILLDGTPVYNSSHLFGLFSVFNPDIIKNVDLYKGAFPARYGGRLSSVVDISMKDGDMHGYHGEVSLGLIASRVMVEGPIIKGKTSFIITGRRTYADLLAQDAAIEGLKLGDSGEFWAYFFDANVKINHIFSPKDRLFLSGYGGRDNMRVKRDKGFDSLNGVAKRYYEKMNFALGWGNQAYSLRWNHIYNPRLFSNVTVNYSEFLFDTEYEYKFEAQNAITEKDSMYGRYFSKVQNAGAKIDFEFRPNPLHTFRFGAQATWHIFQPGITRFMNVSDSLQLTDTAYNNITNKGVELSLYWEDDFKIADSMYLNLGTHASSFLVSGRSYISVQPRLGFRYLLPRKWAFKLSYTSMTQYIHLLTNNATFLPTDLWVATTKKVPPMFSNQFAIGLAKTSNDNMFEMSMELYAKTMQNVIEYQETADNFQSATNNWEDNVVVGRGWSYGSEFLLQKKKGKFKGWIGYTLAWSERAFPNVNNGAVFPYKYDRRHDLEVVLTQQLGKRWELSAQWEFATGAPLTLPSGSYERIMDPSPHLPPTTVDPRDVDLIGNRNTLRMENTHRLDIGATHTKVRKRTRYILNISLYNVYNQKNPFFYTYKRNEETLKRELTKFSILPILPSISYAIKF